nr:CHAT domain-containing protein [uncultured Desulfobacter sp.]
MNENAYHWIVDYTPAWLRKFFFAKQGGFNSGEESIWLDINKKMDECIGQNDLKSAIHLGQHALRQARKTFGQGHDRTGITHFVLGTLYVKTGLSTLARDHFQQAWNIHKKCSTDEGRKFASTTFQTLLKFYSTNKQHKRVEKLLYEGLAAWEKYLRNQSNFYFAIINTLVQEYVRTGAHAKAERLLVSKLKQVLRLYGRNTAIYGYMLGNLGMLYSSQNQPGPAITSLFECLEILQELENTSTKEYASFVYTLFQLYTATGEPDRAEKIYQDALMLSMNLKHAHLFQNFSQTLWDMGEYGKAQPFLEKLVDIFRGEINKDHPDDIPVNSIAAMDLETNKISPAHGPYVAAMKRLANLHIVLGEYQWAASLYTKIWKMSRCFQGLKNPGVSFSMMGEVGEKLIGKQPDNPALKSNPDILNYLESLGTAARLFFTIGDYSSCMEVAGAAYTGSEAILGKEHPLYLQSLVAYAQMETAIGESQSAIGHFQQCIKTSISVLGDHSPIFRDAVQGLARVLEDSGLIEKALKAYQLILATLDETRPSDTLSLFNVKISMARIQANAGNSTDAIQCLLKSAFFFDKMLGHIMAYGYNERLEDYIFRDQSLYHMLFSLFVNNHHEFPEFIEPVYDVLLKRKALIREWVLQKKIHIQKAKDPAQSELFFRLKKLQEDFASQLNRSRFFPLSAGKHEYREKEELLLGKCVQEIRSLEKSLAAQSPQYSIVSGIRRISLEEVLEKLPEGFVLIDFVHFTPFDVGTRDPEYEKLADFKTNFTDYWMLGTDKKSAAEDIQENFDFYSEMSTRCGFDFQDLVHKLGLDDTELTTPGHGPAKGRYAAFILKKEHPRLQVVDMGEAGHIESLITALKEEISEWRKKKSATFFTKTAHALSQAVFTPLLEAMNGCKNMLISADGALFEFPFEILPLPDNRYLIEDYDIHYVDAARDVINFNDTATAKSLPLIIADPDFDLCLSPEAPQTPSRACRSHSEDGPRFTECIRTFFDDEWPGFPRLEGAREEGRHVQELLGPKAVLWEGDQALKSKLLRICSPQILHLATHGFVFQGNRSFKKNNKGPWFGQFTNPELEVSGSLDTPLLRSGLLLAGVNSFFCSHAQDPGIDDGILTAVDISSMDMVGTDLVVLSACSTGLGEVKPGEGVYGMRRAFILAGAKSLVVSLWPVPDQETKTLLSMFYHNLNKGLSKSAALKEAKLAMIRDARTRHDADHPYSWGAFICVGDPSPLERFTS